MATPKANRRIWAMIPPWLIVGTVVVLLPIFAVVTLESIGRQSDLTTRLLIGKGEVLIRSLEAGARTGIGMHWGGFQFQKFLIETAQERDIDYLIATDTDGTILADSDPARLGLAYGLDLDLQEIAAGDTLAWRQVPNAEGADTFEVYRSFTPTNGPFSGFTNPFFAPPPPEDPILPGWLIFIGMDMGPILAAQERDRRQTLWMAGLFFLIGFAGIASLLLAHGYRTARSSLSRMKAFSDSLVEHLPIGLLALDGAERVTAFNDIAATLFGQSVGMVLGRPASEVLSGPYKELLGELTRRQRLIEREINCPVAGRTLPLEVIATPLEDEEGVRTGYILLFRDMTEVRRLNQEIARSRRMASLGSLAAGVAHEIRNPLSSIKGFAAYFRERHGDIPEEREAAEVMIREVDRLNRVISQLLEFARPLTMKCKPTPLAALIRLSLHMVEVQAKEKGIAITTALSPQVTEIPLDGDRFSQVLLNLYLNAIAAMEKGGTLWVSLVPGEEGQVLITVTDQGNGIAKEDLPLVFDPYFTTKPSGTGLGLPIVQKIVEAHGGEVWLETEAGKGTKVIIRLPGQPAGGRPA
ncbi:MAG: ATP-binding protein [Syntrophaceae bacterium]|nr:ATP-binding protein [Syntrophaceae bacterium]